jgi:homocysteine S-methyltransferase
MGRNFLEELHERVLIGDGAIGTELLARGATVETGIERLNLLAPDIVRNLHREYIASGSRVIETNTFNACAPALSRFGAEHESRDVILAGARLACEAAEGHDVYIAGSIGPIPPVEGEQLPSSQKSAVFRDVVDALLEGGVDLLMFETFTDLEDLALAVTYARNATVHPIIAQMAFEKDGVTAGGDTAETFVQRMRALGVDVAGANCGAGAPSIIDAITRMRAYPLPLIAYLNAGFPEDIEGRKVYLATPVYMAQRACQLIDLGVRLIGGCCGTGPETIRAIAGAVSIHCELPSQPFAHIVSRPAPVKPPAPPAREEPRVPAGPLVELDPPQGTDAVELLAAARDMKAAGVRCLTVADNPLASACAGVMAVAGMIMRETGLTVIPHLTGRDRNRIALQSEILAAHLQGIRSILCVTGDPVRMYNETNTSGVFDLVSISLVRLVSEFNTGKRTEGNPTAFSIGVAFNPNVKSIDSQVAKLLRKIEAGAHFALTQPLFDRRNFLLMREALDKAGIKLPVFAGILPLRSWKNAEYLHNEVPGIVIPAELRDRLARYDTLADQRKAGVEIALELMEEFRPGVHGFYLIAPRNRVEQVLPLVKAAKIGK